MEDLQRGAGSAAQEGPDDHAHGGSAAAGPGSGREGAPAGEAGAGAGKPWWAFWAREEGRADGRKEGEAPGTVPPAAGSSSSSSSRAGGSGQQQPDGHAAQGRGAPWWQFWRRGGDGEATSRAEEPSVGEGREQEGEAGRPVDAIIIPPDLPLEDIAECVCGHHHCVCELHHCVCACMCGLVGEHYHSVRMCVCDQYPSVIITAGCACMIIITVCVIMIAECMHDHHHPARPAAGEHC